VLQAIEPKGKEIIILNKYRRASNTFWPLLALVASLAIAGCQTPQQRVEKKEDNLAAAGFTIRPANTPERISMLRSLPPNRFSRQIKGSKVTYVYADPLDCSCLYIGSQQDYGRYRQAMQQMRLANEQQLTALEMSDASWDWGPWGFGDF
jgi:hypothetical protein